MLMHILLVLTGSIAIGMGTVDDLTIDDFVVDSANRIESEFEDDLCFDVLVMPMHLDMIVENYGLHLWIGEKAVEWAYSYVLGGSIVLSSPLPLRAPPAIG